MNNQDEVPRELFVRPGGRHPLERIFDQSLSKNSLRKVTKEDSQRLLIEEPMSLLDWLADCKPCIPKQRIDNLINETTEPLLLYTLRRELRVDIDKGNLEPVEALGRIIKLRVQAKGRSRVSVLFMLPCEEKLQQAWKLYYHGVRYWMKYLMIADDQAEESDQPEVIDQTEADDQTEVIDQTESGNPAALDEETETDDPVEEDDQTNEFNGQWRLLHAKIHFRAAIREIIHLSPGILAIGELAYILYEFVKILNSLDIQVHDPEM